MSVPLARPVLTQPLRAPGRWQAAGALLVVGAVHVPLVPEHLAEAPYVGVLFIALAAVCGVLAVALVVRDSPVVWLTAAVVPALAVAAYVLSRSVGLPQLADDIGHWLDPLGVTALATEVLAAATAGAVLARWQHLQV